MSFADDLQRWAAQALALRKQNQIATDVRRLLRGADTPTLSPMPRSGYPPELGEARPPTSEIEALVTSVYCETGLLIFDTVDCSLQSAAQLAFTDSIRSWVSARSSASAFSLIGTLDFSASTWAYPPIDSFPGSTDKAEGLSDAWICPRAQPIYGQDATAVASHPASIWSGPLMQQYIQARYGAGAAVENTDSAMAVVIDGARLENSNLISHWIYEHRDASRTEWWGIEARGNGELNVGRIQLDALGQLIASYITDRGISDETDLAWLRNWAFARAQWPAVVVEITDTLPLAPGLGYGWHVSDSGLLASIHAYELVNDGMNYGSEWTRHDLTLTVSHPPTGEPTWGASVATTSTGYLETQYREGLAVWSLSHAGIPGAFMTDQSSFPPIPLPSSAEIFGRYNGEAFEGVTVTDSGSSTQNCSTNGPALTCEQHSGRCYGGTCTPGGQGCANARNVSVGGTSGQIGNGISVQEYSYSFAGDKLDFPEWQTGLFSGWCVQNALEPECPDGEDPTGARWAGTYSVAARVYTAVGGIVRSDKVAFVVPRGICDSHIVLEGETSSCSALHRTSETGTSQQKQYVLQSVYLQQACAVSGTWVDAFTYEGTPNQPAISGAFFNHNEVTVQGTPSRTSLVATLKTRSGDLSLWSSSGGNSIAASSTLLDEYQGSGTMQTGGWDSYIVPVQAGDPPEPIYGQRSAVQGIVSSCTAPGCPERTATDSSAGDPFPSTAVWIGAA